MIDNAEIREQLKRILVHPSLQTGRCPEKFLTYVVGETLAGRCDRIKAYTIAVAVLSRPETFDPQRDPSVRVLAGRVRNLLKTYYATDGRDDPIVISIPLGRYKAKFTRNTGPQSASTSANSPNDTSTSWQFSRGRSVSGNSLPVLVLSACKHFGREKWRENFCAGFDNALFLALSKWEPICLCTEEANAQGGNKECFSDPMRERFLAECALINTTDDQTKLYLKVHHLNTGQVIWADAFALETGIDNDFGKQQELAEKIADHIVQPFGTISRDAILFSRETPIDQLSVFECLLQNLNYYANASDATFDRAMMAARQAVKIAPNFGLSWATLTDLHCEKYRMAYGGLKASQNALDDAMHCAQEALRCNSLSAYGHLGLSNTLFARGDIDGGVRIGDKAVELNPGNSGLKAKYGHHRAYAGDWEAGCEILVSAMSQQIRLKDYQTYVLAEQAFRTGEFTRALDYVSQTRQTEIYFQPMFHAASYAHMGLKPEATEALRLLKQREPDFTVGTAVERLSRDVHHGFVDQMADGLRRAGLAA